MTRRLACVVLVDERGWLLLQERDEGAPTAPDQWSLVGGSVEAGEQPTSRAVAVGADLKGRLRVGLRRIQPE